MNGHFCFQFQDCGCRRCVDNLSMNVFLSIDLNTNVGTLSTMRKTCRRLDLHLWTQVLDGLNKILRCSTESLTAILVLTNLYLYILQRQGMAVKQKRWKGQAVNENAYKTRHLRNKGESPLAATESLGGRFRNLWRFSIQLSPVFLWVEVICLFIHLHDLYESNGLICEATTRVSLLLFHGASNVDWWIMGGWWQDTVDVQTHICTYVCFIEKPRTLPKKDTTFAA